jgi:hypothetical protein
LLFSKLNSISCEQVGRRSLQDRRNIGVCRALPSLAWDPAKLEHEWRLDGREGAVSTIRHRPRFVTEDMVALRLAALRGVGVCQFPAFVVEEDLRTGRLIDLLPDWAPKSGHHSCGISIKKRIAAFGVGASGFLGKGICRIRAPRWKNAGMKRKTTADHTAKNK